MGLALLLEDGPDAVKRAVELVLVLGLVRIVAITAAMIAAMTAAPRICQMVKVTGRISSVWHIAWAG